jgi:hypothetical protein
MVFTSTLPYMLMIWLLQHLIHKSLCRFWKTSTSSSLKELVQISVRLGMNFHRDQEGKLCISPTKYIEKMINTYKKFFGEAPRNNDTSPLEQGDHPELGTLQLLDSDGITIYHSSLEHYNGLYPLVD